MIDATSINALLETMPADAGAATKALGLKLEDAKSIPRSARDVARRGYLGCVRLAKGIPGDDIVLQLVPNIPVTRSRVSLALQGTTEAQSFAPDLRHFVAGRMAYLDYAGPKRNDTPADLAAVVDFAREFDGEKFAEQVLDAIPEARKLDAWNLRRAALWAALAEDPLCETLAAAWSHKLEDIGAALAALSPKARETLIARRLNVSFQDLQASDVDITQDAWTLVEADNLFDPTYTGTTYGPMTGAYLSDAMAISVQWLGDRSFSPKADRKALWEAALKREDKRRYDGRDHLTAAKELAADAPEIAYQQTLSAAAYHVRATGNAPKEAMAFGLELARSHGWTDLALVLEWGEA